MSLKYGVWVYCRSRRRAEARRAEKLFQRGTHEAGSYLRLIDSCITQLTAQGPSRTCNESQEEEEVSFGEAPTLADALLPQLVVSYTSVLGEVPQGRAPPHSKAL